MKTLLTKSLSIFMCVLMVFSLGTTAFAANTINAKADVKYFQTATEKENAKTVLDVADEFLAGLEQPTGDTKKLLDGLKAFGITIAYGSVNDILKTIDSVKSLDSALNLIGGDIKDLNFDVWQKNMQRNGDDVKALYEVIELLGTTEKKKVLFSTADLANPEIIAKVIKGDINLGALKDYVSVEDFLGKDGIYGAVKGGFVEAVYEKDSAEYNVAYSKTLDYFLYEDLIPALLGGEDDPLPGFTMSNTSTVDTLLTAVLYSTWNTYSVTALKSINADWAKDENGNVKENLKDLVAAVNFDGSTFDPSTVKFDLSQSLADQLNNALGAVAKHFVSDFAWEEGDYTKISKNLNNLLLHVARKLGITTSTTSTEAVALDIAKYVLARIEGDGVDSYVSGIENCKNMKEAAVIVLRNTAEISGIKVTDKENATYEEILGDILVALIGKYVDLGYRGGNGKNVWDVLNDVVNIYFFDQELANALNLSVKKEENVFAKLDKIIEMTGIFVGLTPAENYKAEGYLKGLIEAVLSLNLEKIVDLTVVRFIGDFGQKNAIKTVYEFLATTLKSFFGRDIIVAYSESNPLNTLIKNENLAETVKNILIAFNERKSYLIPVILNGANFLINPEIPATEITVSEQPYNSTGLPDTVKVKAGGKEFTLVNGVDYTGKVNGTASPNTDLTATLDLSGFVKGTAEINYKLILEAVKNLKATDVKTDSVTLTWDKATGAKVYEIICNNTVTAVVEDTKYTVENLTAGTEYTYSVRANNNGETAAEVTVTFTTLPEKVKNIKASAVTSTTAKLTWDKVPGAASYEVSYSTDGKKWTKTTASSNTVALKKLTANKEYRIIVKAYNKNAQLYSEASDTIKVKTAPAKVTNLKAKTVTSTTVTLSWKKVTGATQYIVYYSTNGKKWSSTKTKKTSVTLKKLSANKKYYFKVQAVKGSLKGDESAKLTASTAVAAVTSLKAKTKKATSITLSWKKVTGATGYEVYKQEGKKWKKIGTIKKSKTTTYTVKKLKKNTSYKFKVRAVKSKTAGDFSKVLTVKTAKK